MVRLISLLTLASAATVLAAPMKYVATTAISDGDVAFSAVDGELESTVETATSEAAAAYETSAVWETSSAEEKKYYETSAEEKKYYETTEEQKKYYETSAEEKKYYETSVAEATSTAMAHEVTSTVAYEASSTSEAKEAYTSAAVQYGSGYNNWGNSYNDCVQQCLAKFGNPSATATVAETTAVATETAGSGTGTTHTIIVAPTQGVLRYVPWAVNASVGDTIQFKWGAGPHSVTQSSALQVCNKTQEAGAFDTLPQNASFIHEEIVKTTEPTFFYCTVGVHCSKGMFGVINPTMATPGADSSLDSQMKAMAANNTDVATMWQYTEDKTKGSEGYGWGANFDMSAMPQEAYSAVFENTLYARLFFGSNPGLIETGEGASGDNLNIPTDISAALTTSNGGGYGTPSTSGDVPPANAESAQTTESSTPVPNGASRSVVSSTAIVGAIAIVVSFLAL